MPSLPLPAAKDNRQEYRMAKGWRIFTYIGSPLLAALFLSGPFLFWQRGDAPGVLISLSLLMVGMAVFCLLSIWEAYKARHIITADELLYEGAFYRKAIPLAHIAGYRMGGQYTFIVSKDPADPRIRIGYTSEHYAAMQQWLADHYPDLDEQAATEDAAAALEDDALGATAEVRETTLRQASQVAQVLNGAGWVVAGWLIFWPRHYEWAVAAGVLLPLLTIGILGLSRGALRPDGKKNSAYPSVFPALFMPSIALTLRMLLDFELLTYSPLWPVAGAVAGGFGLLLYLSGRAVWKRSPDTAFEMVATVLLCAISFGYAATMAANCLLDKKPATTYPASVVGKRISNGKTTTYYLKLGPWGPRQEDEDVTVTRAYFSQKSVGEQVIVYVRPGWLHLAWVEVGE